MVRRVCRRRSRARRPWSRSAAGSRFISSTFARIPTTSTTSPKPSSIPADAGAARTQRSRVSGVHRKMRRVGDGRGGASSLPCELDFLRPRHPTASSATSTCSSASGHFSSRCHQQEQRLIVWRASLEPLDHRTPQLECVLRPALVDLDRPAGRICRHPLRKGARHRCAGSIRALVPALEAVVTVLRGKDLSSSLNHATPLQ